LPERLHLRQRHFCKSALTGSLLNGFEALTKLKVGAFQGGFGVYAFPAGVIYQAKEKITKFFLLVAFIGGLAELKPN